MRMASSSLCKPRPLFICIKLRSLQSPCSRHSLTLEVDLRRWASQHLTRLLNYPENVPDTSFWFNHLLPHLPLAKPSFVCYQHNWQRHKNLLQRQQGANAKFGFQGISMGSSTPHSGIYRPPTFPGATAQRGGRSTGWQIPPHTRLASGACC